MAGVTIKALRNGPYEVSGGPTLLDSHGGSYPDADQPIYLCRCGQSAKKPFCDGSHKRVAFTADEQVGR
jgi:3-phenylpropionate/trans-cinnamate dioxygenase ferredoxin subunit